jgi:aryl-alcohol dehydrogenase-like predicted oxidoreductase
VGLHAISRVRGLVALPPGCCIGHVGAETVDEVTANATAADVRLEQAQLDALTTLGATDEDT